MTMVAEAIEPLLICQEIEIAAPIEAVFAATLVEMGPEGQKPDGSPMNMKLEPWPGGRWFRDLGNDTGHLWGHVQVILPPTLIEICGPLFMSYPAISHVQYRLTAEGKKTRLKLTHRALGQISAEHREGAQKGWTYKSQRVRELAERRQSQS